MTSLTITCPIHECQWEYSSVFSTEQLFQILRVHIKVVHVQELSEITASKTTETVLPHAGKCTDSVNAGECSVSNCTDSKCVNSVDAGKCRINRCMDTLENDRYDCSVEPATQIAHNTGTDTVEPPIISSTHKIRILPARSAKVPCPSCTKFFHRFNGRNAKAFQCCLKCFRNYRNRGRTPADQTSPQVVENEFVQQNLSITSSISCGGIKSSPSPHPTVAFRLRQVGGEAEVTIMGVADTGAQSNVWGLSDYLSAGFSEEDLQNVSLKISAANKQRLDVVGGFLAEMSGGASDGTTVKCRTMVYVTRNTSGFYISFDTLIALMVVNNSFSMIGACPSSAMIGSMSMEFVEGPDSACFERKCKCPQRSAVPSRPRQLPFKPVEGNNVRMREWLLDYFKSSTFNVCPHKPLQEMSGPPISIHIVDSAKPRVCKTPATIALHWQKRVEEDLKRDEALGILEKVPYDVPVTWCHRMVVTRKHDGTPRRTVDLSPLNQFCSRETHSTESPFHLARRIPAISWKTVTDAWNGYHSVPLRESDRHLTTFITPFGRWRYTRFPRISFPQETVTTAGFRRCWKGSRGKSGALTTPYTTIRIWKSTGGALSIS